MGGEAGLSLSHLCASVPLTMTSFARRSRVPLVFTGFGLLKTWNRKLKYGGEFSWNSTSNSGKVSWGGILVCYWEVIFTRKLFLLFFFLGERILPLPVHSTKQILTPASWAGGNRFCWLLWTADVERGEEEEAEKLMNKGGFTIQWRFQS